MTMILVIEFLKNIIPNVLEWIRKKAMAVRDSIRGATFNVGIEGKVLIIKNVSTCKAYNVDMKPSNNLFCRSSFTKQQCVEPGRSIIVKTTRLTSNSKSGDITLTWTNKKGNKKYEKTYPVYF